jgi:hypothetical protein
MNTAPPQLNVAQASSPCWFVGAMVDGRDQTDRFIDEGIWEHGFDDDRIDAQVRSMRMGERIAIKASYIGTPEKVRSTAAQLVSAIETR